MRNTQRTTNGASAAEKVNIVVTDTARTDLVSEDAAHASPLRAHSHDVRRWYERALAGSEVNDRYVEVASGRRVHLLQKGSGPPLVLIHGSGVSAGFLLPLLNELEGVRGIAPDLPGQGLSDPIDLAPDSYRATAVAWLDRLLDSLELDRTAMLGHSAGGLWALWYALAHPDRISRLVLIGPPALPMTRCPLPYRFMATPGVGKLVSRYVLPRPKSVLWFAGQMGERATIRHHPDFIDLFVVAARDPIAAAGLRTEIRTLVSPFALLEPSGFRRRSRVRPDELYQLTLPTLLLWGEQEPLGSVEVAQAVTDLIPKGRLQVLPGGHAPWLGHPRQISVAIADFLCEPSRAGGAIERSA